MQEPRCHLSLRQIPREDSPRMSAVRRAVPSILASLILFGGAACGGGGGGGGGGAGLFYDGPVAGLDYQQGTTAGVTDSEGRFSFGGGPVEFRLGGTSLGSAAGAALVSPVDLVAGAFNETDPVVTNIARLLQTCDSDSNPANGITISDSLRTALASISADVQLPQAQFEADSNVAAIVAAAGANSLVSVVAARNHLRGNLINRNAGLYTGTYNDATFGGTFPFALVVTRDGTLLGYAIDDDGDELGLSGSTSSAGESIFGNTTSGADFVGQFGNGNGELNGTWTSSVFMNQGTYRGARQGAFESFLDMTSVALYPGTYDIAIMGGGGANLVMVINSDGSINLPVTGTTAAFTMSTADMTSTRIVGADIDGDVFDLQVLQTGAVSGTGVGADGTRLTFSGARR